MKYEIEKPRPGMYYVHIHGRQYAVHYSPNREYAKSKPWKVDDVTSGWIPICRTKTKKEGVRQVVENVKVLVSLNERLNG